MKEAASNVFWVIAAVFGVLALCCCLSIPGTGPIGAGFCCIFLIVFIVRPHTHPPLPRHTSDSTSRAASPSPPWPCVLLPPTLPPTSNAPASYN